MFQNGNNIDRLKAVFVHQQTVMSLAKKWENEFLRQSASNKDPT